MVKDLKRLEWRREKLREAFMVPDMVEAPAGDATLDARLASRRASPGSPSANAWSFS